MKQPKIEIDSGILQFVPKGAYYENSDEQYQKIMETWKYLFDHDRLLFCLLTLLEGTGFSKGSMTHMLLDNPQPSGNQLVPTGLSFDYETKVIQYNLKKERTPRALKNLLMLAGRENKSKVNNSRARQIIFEYIFNRKNEELDALAINYKNKLRMLIRHALGKYDLYKILNGNMKLFNKWIGKFNSDAYPVFMHIFDQELPKGFTYKYFKKINQYNKLRQAAKQGDVDNFQKYMKGLPHRTVIGFRNTFKLPVDLKEVYEKSTRSKRDALQSDTAAKRRGAKIQVNYKNQDVYDLWKILYHKVMNDDFDNVSDIIEGIEYQTKRMDKLNIGEVVVIIDASHSMVGNEQRPLHPFLTAYSIMSLLENIKNVIYVGGTLIGNSSVNLVIPSGATDLWRGLVDAVASGAKNILVISDGYENSIKGTFDHVYSHFKNSGYDFELMHINPVFSADAKTGSVRTLVKDIKPLPISNYKYLETEIIFNKLLEDRNIVKNILVNKYTKLIEEGGLK